MKKQLISNKINSRPYQRLQTELGVIISKTKVGEKLLSEPDLSRSLGVSRSTLREAMRLFEAQGLIRRRQGLGTFVVDKHQIFETGLEKLESIETIARRNNLAVTMGELITDKIQVDGKLKDIFNISAGQQLLQVKRIILAEGRPVAYLVDTVLENLLSEQDLQKSFTGSVLDLLMKRSQPVLTKSFTEIQAVAAPLEIARALQIQRGDALLQFIADLFATDGQAVDHSESYFLPGYFRFHVVRSVGG